MAGVETLGAVRGEFGAIEFFLGELAEPVEDFVAFVEFGAWGAFGRHFEGEDAFEDIGPEFGVFDDVVVVGLGGEIEVAFLFIVAVAFIAIAVDFGVDFFVVELAVGGVFCAGR